MNGMEPAAGIRFNRRYLLAAVLLALALYVLIPQVGIFKSSWHLLGQAVPGWLALSVGSIALTYLAGAATYCLLAIKPLKYGPTLLVQFAAMFVNRLLPAGLGAIGANYAYLRRQKHSRGQAAVIVAMNNLFGMVGHTALVVFSLLVLSGSQVALAPSYGHLAGSWFRFLLLALLVVGGLMLVFGWRRFKRQAIKLRRQILNYRQRPWRLPAALLSSMTLTLGNVFSLLVCGLAIGVHLPFVVVLMVFTFGIGAGTATPVPGGLGGFEAGLTAGFIAYHVPAPAALATALLYRLVSYWLPLCFGALAFIAGRNRYF